MSTPVPAPTLTPAPSPPRPLHLRLTPRELLAAWPPHQPLTALCSDAASPHARWSILARPAATSTYSPATAADALALLRSLLEAPSGHNPKPDEPPFQGGRILALSYDLGRVLEPAVGPAPHAPTTPLILSHDCPDSLIYDHSRGQWWSVGSPPLPDPAQPASTFTLSTPTPDLPASHYTAAVNRILDYIRAGDAYQVNLAHRLTARFTGSPRSLFLGLLRAAAPWYGAYLESPSLTLASASPELFLSYDPATRTLTTRPMKGTRPFTHAADLQHSDKDAAELNMITDLMRNDLGRVSELGSVRVQTPRALEQHNTLAQTTSTVTSTLRAGLTLADALAATFPGGSITGCPKIRAMQIIDELEPAPRAFYCGAIGYISATGHAAFSIAIRTATLRGGTLHYSTGAGITIGSDPEAEYQETLDKAAILQRL